MTGNEVYAPKQLVKRVSETKRSWCKSARKLPNSSCNRFVTNTQILYSDGDIFIPIEFPVKFEEIKVEKIARNLWIKRTWTIDEKILMEQIKISLKNNENKYTNVCSWKFHSE